MTTERRKLPRHPLVLPIETSFGSGLTRDISATGLYFESCSEVAVGSSFDLAILFSGREVPTRARAEATVVRIEPHENSIGIAAALSWIEFETTVMVENVRN